jgi:hypothetical protein
MPTIEITEQQMREWLTRAVNESSAAERDTKREGLLDLLAFECLQADDIYLGVAVEVLRRFHVANCVDDAAIALLAFGYGEMNVLWNKCVVCGREERNLESSPEYWSAIDLCSDCAPPADAATPADAGEVK